MTENRLLIKDSIVLVSFPFDDFSNSKLRPALCLTSEIGNYELIVIAFISSRIPNDSINCDLIIRKRSENSKGSGLMVDSIIRLHKIVKIPKRIIKRKLGMINKSVQIEVRKRIMQLFEYE